MFINKKKVSLLLAYTYVFTLSLAPSAISATYNGTVYFNTSPLVAAANCSITLPDEQPLSIPRILVLDNSIANGTEVFSWGYGEMFSNVSVTCVSTGITSSTGALAGFSSSETLYVMNVNDAFSGVQLNNAGLRLKLWARANVSSYPCSGTVLTCGSNNYSYIANNGGGNAFMAAGEEFALSGGMSRQLSAVVSRYHNGAGFVYPSSTINYSIRGAIIKVGNVSYGPLSAQTNRFYFSGNSTGMIATGLNGAGITIVPPSCKLKITDYNISMGRWAADVIDYAGAPAYGSQVPINLSMECSGKVNHVRFRFEDTGISLSSNKNISLYDSVAGNKIEGLEIEMLYNGSKVNIDNITITDTGSHGISKTSPGSMPLFDSLSTASFHARYRQSSSITRSGVNYTGPVMGRLNIHMTYD